MKSRPGTWILIFLLLAVFGVEIATHTMGNGTALLKLGALPQNGRLNGEYWRFLTYAFLHLNWTHIIVNLALLWWVGRIVERRDMAAFGQDNGLRTGLWICLAIGFGISFLPGVSLAGHIGGLIAGLVLGTIVTAKEDASWFRIRKHLG